MRFLHTADWQIGMKALGAGKAAPRVRDARLEAARRVGEAVREHQVDFLLVAGDTFESNAVDRLLVRRVAELLDAAGAPVYILSGNHDPLGRGSVWEHDAWRNAKNVRVIRERAPIDVPGGVLLPCPVLEKYSHHDPTAWINACGEERIAIGLAHGTVEGIPAAEKDYPVPRDAAARGGLDYLALGHWHSYAAFPAACGDVRMAYSGTHETTKFGERDSGNVLIVDIAGRGALPVIRPVRTGVLTWETFEEEIKSPGDLAAVRRRMESIQDRESTLLRARLLGVLHPEDIDDLDAVRRMLAEIPGWSGDVSGLLPRPDDDDWVAELPGEILRQTGARLVELADPAFAGERPDYATREVAALALLELYGVVHQVGS